jgi:ketosteroid isomerase-like protein
MAVSNGKMEKLIIAENDRYVIECQHSKTNREDGNNLEHFSTVLWTFENGKIIEGRHFFADPQAVDSYFTAVAPVHAEK